MKKEEKSKIIQKILNDIYPKVPIPLSYKNTFTLLVSVLLSAQCTDERVNKITPILFNLADCPQDMINLSISQIEDVIRPCGLSPMKSKGIYGLSKMIIERFDGKVPKTLEELESFPSVGHKTASVVISQAFGIPAFPVDTHIHRLMYRWGLTNGKSVQNTEKDAQRLFPSFLWNKLHLQIIYYGRQFSPARGWNINNDFITLKTVSYTHLTLPTKA